MFAGSGIKTETGIYRSGTGIIFIEKTGTGTGTRNILELGLEIF